MMIKYALLGLLREGPSHGYRLRCLFERRIGRHWALNLGQVYQTLAHIERAGWIRPHRGGRAADRQTKTYEITDKGRQVFARWQLGTLRPPPPLRHDLFLRLAFVDESAQPALESALREFQQWVRSALEDAEEDAKRIPAQTGGLSRLVFLEATTGQLTAMLETLIRCQELLEKTSLNREAERAAPPQGSAAAGTPTPSPAAPRWRVSPTRGAHPGARRDRRGTAPSR